MYITGDGNSKVVGVERKLNEENAVISNCLSLIFDTRYLVIDSQAPDGHLPKLL